MRAAPSCAGRALSPEPEPNSRGSGRRLVRSGDHDLAARGEPPGLLESDEDDEERDEAGDYVRALEKRYERRNGGEGEDDQDHSRGRRWRRSDDSRLGAFGGLIGGVIYRGGGPGFRSLINEDRNIAGGDREIRQRDG